MKKQIFISLIILLAIINTSRGQSWSLTGNAATTPGTNYIGTTDSKNLVFKTAAVERIRILSTGYIGVGTLTPQGIFDITYRHATLDGNIYLTGNKAGANQNSNSPKLNFVGEGAAASYAIQAVNTGTYGRKALVFYGHNSDDYTTYQENIRFTNDGNIGVGTTTPTSKLDVYKSAATNGNELIASFIRAPTTTGGSGIVRLGYHNTCDFELNSGYGSNGYRFGEYYDLNIVNNNTGGTYGAINFATNGSSRMSIKANGNVGVGTLAPSNKLDIIGGLSIGSGNVNGNTTKMFLRNPVGKTWAISSGGNMINETDFTIYNWTDHGNEATPKCYFNITKDGNVGIGVPDPTSNLEISGDMRFRNNGSKIYMGANDYIQFTDGSNDGYKFVYDDIERVRITNSGQLLIGKTSQPVLSIKLDVVGTIRANEIIVNTTGGADFVFDENYKLRSLAELGDFVTANKHLPEIPTADQMQKDGVNMGELQIKLLQKIEELTLYVIELEKKYKDLESKVTTTPTK